MSNTKIVDKCLICSRRNKIMIPFHEALSGYKFSAAQLLENLNFLTILDGEQGQLCFLCVSKVQFCYKFKTKCHQVETARIAEANCRQLDPQNDDSDSEEAEEIYLVQSDSDEEIEANNFEGKTTNVILMDKKGQRTSVDVFEFDVPEKKTTDVSFQIASSTVPENEKKMINPPIIMCPICQKNLPSMVSYRRHYRAHTGDKPYTCDVCKKAYRQLNALLNHIPSHRNPRQLSCEICQKSFKFKQNLKKHYKVHTDLKPYTCDVCKRSFRFAKSYRNHKLIHVRENSYICGVCGEGFVYRSAFQKHVADKHPEATSYVNSIFDKPCNTSSD